VLRMVKRGQISYRSRVLDCGRSLLCEMPKFLLSYAEGRKSGDVPTERKK
jgi:hypothetical protein